MRRTIIVLATLAALCLGAALSTAAATASTAPRGSITMRINCVPGHNQVQIFNDTDEGLDLRTWTVASLVRPGLDEPIALKGFIVPGSGLTFFSGAGKDYVLIGHDIFQPDQPDEGARLTTPYGILDVLCTAERGTLPLGELPGLPNTGGGGGTTRPIRPAAASAATITLFLLVGGWFVRTRHRRGRRA